MALHALVEVRAGRDIPIHSGVPGSLTGNLGSGIVFDLSCFTSHTLNQGKIEGSRRNLILPLASFLDQALLFLSISERDLVAHGLTPHNVLRVWILGMILLKEVLRRELVVKGISMPIPLHQLAHRVRVCKLQSSIRCLVPLHRSSLCGRRPRPLPTLEAQPKPLRNALRSIIVEIAGLPGPFGAFADKKTVLSPGSRRNRAPLARRLSCAAADVFICAPIILTDRVA